MALIMNDEQRAKALEEYNPREHLIEVAKDKKGPVYYYPAAWRLYELRLRYPFFTLEAEIIHMDEEKGTVIVKAIGYDGFDYASSNLKGTALKQGPLKDLDKVETKAKSRVARDIGIGTEYALDMESDETGATQRTRQNGAASSLSSEPVPDARQSLAVQKMLATAKNRVASLGKEWNAIRAEAKLAEIADDELTVQQIATINGVITTHEKKAS